MKSWQILSILRGLVLIATIVAIGYAVKDLGLSDLFGTHWIDAQVKGKGLSGEALYVVVGAVAAAIGMPRQIVCFLGGYAFGVIEGTALALLASVSGCILAFFYARFIGRGLIARRFSRQTQKIDAILNSNPLTMALIIRLLPVGSNLVTNLAAGLSNIRALPFFAGSALGYLPQTIIFGLLGSGVQLEAELRIAFSAALFVIAGLLGVVLYRRAKKFRLLAEEDDKGGDSPVVDRL